MMEPARQGYAEEYAGYEGYDQVPGRRSWLGALVYWNRRNKYYMRALPKLVWWTKFLVIGGLLPEGLIDALSAIPVLGTPLLAADVAELPAEGLGATFVAWLTVKLFFKLVFRSRNTWESFREISEMRDYHEYPPWYYNHRWVPRWMPV